MVSHISLRVAHVLVGAALAVVWLVLPGMATSPGAPVAITPDRSVASGAAPEEDETSTADLVLPLVAGFTAGALAGYAYVRRVRRARGRTTPGGGAAAPAPGVPADLHDLDERSLTLLVDADDSVRTSREELGFAQARFGAADMEEYGRAVREAQAELSAAFRMRQRYDEGVPEDVTARRHALTGIAGRCEEAGRRLDAEVAGFDGLRGLEEAAGMEGALEVAEVRFRELAGRTGGAEASLAGIGERYSVSAGADVAACVEQAKDRLVFATTRLNQARQAADRGEYGRAAGHLRAAEGAVAQTAVFVDGVQRFAAELAEAAAMIPAALTGAEAGLAGVRGWLRGKGTPRVPDVPVGELRARILHADSVLASVRQELTARQPYDPLDVLRRIVRATSPLAAGRAGVLAAAALLTARSATSAADDFVATHRGAVGGTARTRLAEAQRLLATGDPADRPRADALAREARELAEQDVRLHGYPSPGTGAHLSGAAGAVLGGILLTTAPETNPPAAFGGPTTRTRRAPASP